MSSAYEKKYNNLIEIDNTGACRKLYDTLVALSMLNRTLNRVNIDDFHLAALTGIPIKEVTSMKKLLAEHNYIRFNDDDKLEIIKQNQIVADSSAIEIIK